MLVKLTPGKGKSKSKSKSRWIARWLFKTSKSNDDKGKGNNNNMEHVERVPATNIATIRWPDTTYGWHPNVSVS